MVTDPLFTGLAKSRMDNQFFQEQIGAVYAWERGFYGDGGSILVIDTGVNPQAVDLNIKEYRSFSTGDGTDQHGHGTMVSHVINAQHNGILQAGIAPGADLYVAKASLDATGSFAFEDLIESIRWGIELEVDVINMSLGGTFATAEYVQAIKDAVAAGITVVAAAGNAGHVPIGVPGNVDGIWTIGANSRFQTKTGFSQDGDSLDAYAPGENIQLVTLNDQTVVRDGTSFSSPMFAGAALILMQAGVDVVRLLDTALPVYDIPTSSIVDQGKINIGFALHTDDSPLLHIPQSTWVPTQDMTVSYLIPKQDISYAVSVYIETEGIAYDLNDIGELVEYSGEDHLISFENLQPNTELVGNLFGWGGVYDHIQLDYVPEGDYTFHVALLDSTTHEPIQTIGTFETSVI